MALEVLNRNLALELLRVTEGASLAAAPLRGRGDKEAADRRAVEAMRQRLGSVDMRGTVVIGEGEKDQAPMLYFGEEVGNGLEPEVDVAVDPIDGTRLTAEGGPGAVSVVALAERGTMFTTHLHYMEKLVVGRRSRGVIAIDMPIEWNLRRVAKAESLHPRDLTVVVLNRERNAAVIDQIREVGAQVRLISDGDVSGALMAVLETKTGMHVMMGSGGSTEGVLAACAVKALQGDMQARLFYRNDDDRRLALEEGFEPGRVLSIDDLCSGNDIFFAMTGITSGELLSGVRYEEFYAYTHSLVLRSTTGTVRYVDAYHQMSKLRQQLLLPEQAL
ncbi:MAG TPA: class II fructose-bisphosphatase [Candidatus Dormibacteraeota bacterium]|nr:class II fructose-bisphosphatase [Candidatus Dormibacteraeota bacterium]